MTVLVLLAVLGGIAWIACAVVTALVVGRGIRLAENAECSAVPDEAYSRW